MSILSNIGSEVAAKDIQNKIAQLEKKYPNDPKVIEVLTELQKHTEEIIKSAKEGWY